MAVKDIGVKNAHRFLIIRGMVLTKEVEDMEGKYIQNIQNIFHLYTHSVTVIYFTILGMVLVVEEVEEALVEVEVEEDL